VLEWNETLAQDWPAIERALAGLSPGEHHHEVWAGTPDAFWRVAGLGPDDDPQVWVERSGITYRIRILEC